MIVHINSIEELHQALGLAAPRHPLISVIKETDIHNAAIEENKCTMNMYMISLKDGVTCSLNYGRNSYDFSKGTMVFTKPNQVISSDNEKIVAQDSEGWLLFFHPDLIRKSALSKNIDLYSFFDYEVHEALHLSDEEQKIVSDIILKIKREYNQNIDKHSQKLIISNIELLLDYCNRYYDRQFYVRTNLNQDYITEFEKLLKGYFSSEKPQEIGIPSVKYCGEQLNMSPNYLSDVLKKETGKSAKDHIITFVVNKAKNQLLGSTNSVSEIAYNLGFEYPQHFSKVFKRKTGMTPAKFRTLN
jgi:AraC-like DNA-binding protein